jgi:magnesium chelatase accessory protein
MSGRYPDWATDGADWPNRAASRFVTAGGYNWHVQDMGSGPVCLLIHGTGAATHSWRDVMPLLARTHRVIAFDLPGHGFTRPNHGERVTLDGMARGVTALLAALDVTPAIIAGHSAGTAIALQLTLDRGWRAPVVGFTPALMPFPGLAAKLFPSLAKILFTNPFVAIIFARLASGRGETERFLTRATGSRIDAAGARCYQRLFSKSGHCDGTIRMMANWRLEPLRDKLAQVTAPVLLLPADRDSAIPQSAVLAAAGHIPGCRTQTLPRLGHLAHEEDPAGAAEIIAAFGREQD